MTSEQRKNTRISISEEYFYYPEKKNKKINCRLNNISVTGACIISEEKIKTDEIIYLHIRGTDDIALKSKTVWKIDNQYGLQFLLDTSSEFEKISYIMNNLAKLNSSEDYS
ncbi:MAG: PilZ domain-containing protein [Spirochaetes bacterium]|nr:PilZ domain-containing protein [Spirochaetota bacterium]